MNWELYSLFFLTGFLAAAIPGPSIIFTVSQSIRYGALNALPSVSGLMLASIIYGIAALTGAGTLLILVPEVSIGARILGACYLAYIGYKQLTSTAWGLGEGEPESNKVSRRTLVQGFLIGLSNPKIMLFYLMFIPQFVDPSRPVEFQMLVLVLSQYAIKAGILVFYIFAAGFARNWLRTKRSVAILNMTSGGVLIGVAFVLVVSIALRLMDAS